MILLLPIKLVFWWIFAAVIHELSHIVSIHLCGGVVRSVSVGSTGAVIEADITDSKKEALCALAGPVGGFLILFVRKQFPVLAVCGMVQSIFNLIPIYPTDGGRVFLYLLSRIPDPLVAKWVQIIVTRAIFAGLILLGSIALFSGLGPMPLVVVFLFFHRKRKIPCKARQQIVQ